MKIKIESIVEHRNFKTKDGKDVFQIFCYANGNQQFELRTMSQKVKDALNPGLELEAKESNYNGQISYFIDYKSVIKDGGYGGNKHQMKYSPSKYLGYCAKAWEQCKNLASDNSIAAELFKITLNNSGFFVDLDKE